MRSLRFIFIALITFLFVTNVVFLRRTLSVLLCGVISFNSASCYSFLDKYEKADAAAPLSRTFALSNSSSSDADVVPRQKQKVAGCLFGVCVDLPKSPVSIPGIPGGDQKEPIQQANLQSNVSLAGKWQSDWGSVEFNSDLTGHWNQGSGIGQIKDGTYDPKTRKLVFHYYQPWNDMNGTATLTLSEDGNRLLGTWTQQRASNPPGSGGSGGWTMTRDLSQQSVGDARKPLDGKLTIVSLAGKWQSNWGLVEFNSDLSGRWNQGVGIGQIKDGTYDPQTRKLVFHYYQPWNEMDGTTTMMLSEDGNQLSGTWIQQRGSNPAGSGGSGGWVMTRDPSQQLTIPCEGGVVLSQPSSTYYDALVSGNRVEINNLYLRACPERVIHSYGDNPDEKIPAQFEISYKMIFTVPSSQAADNLNQAYSTVNNVISTLAGYLLSKVTGPVKSALGGFGISEYLGRTTHSWKRGDTLTTTYSAVYDPASQITTITETEKLEGTREEAGKEVHKIFSEDKTTYQDSNKPPFSYD
jgi:hypothetical protein